MQTVVSHEIFSAFTGYIFQQMAESPPTKGEAGAVLARFRSLSSDVRGCALLGPDGVLAATGDPARWLEPARAMLDAADSAAGATASHAHVATEDGEAYAVRHAGLAMVAVTERFTLASLVLADMRAALRDLERARVELVEAA